MHLAIALYNTYYNQLKTVQEMYGQKKNPRNLRTLCNRMYLQRLERYISILFLLQLVSIEHVSLL